MLHWSIILGRIKWFGSVKGGACVRVVLKGGVRVVLKGGVRVVLKGGVRASRVKGYV